MEMEDMKFSVFQPFVACIAELKGLSLVKIITWFSLSISAWTGVGGEEGEVR